ncbi:pyridoxamine 5'-phosphate oxidase family protein [Parasphingorhabdus halotolerans]|uniref:Pyridoxamine 5'-phosphate oxidase family protein n=2 Tax=Parasphingorhabdus halotolerans TaxID=2725558 RepID=A0A6H2DS15_9SPHN|nr:pyridoxamine 5'-phosphate oxidase family protein [Parasphingorhabdus halotolerans]
MKTAENIQEIKEEFWEALDDSPYVMVSIMGSNAHAIPMRAQLDKDADSAIWFFTSTDNRLASGGPAMAQFASKRHDLFACIGGTLTKETEPAVFDKLWSNAVEAWYEKGRLDPKLLLLRFDLRNAEIWESDPGIVGMFKMMTGLTMDGNEMGEHAKVAL